MSHTPGPWRARILEVGRPDSSVATIHNHGKSATRKPTEEDLANARLIAAAPELLRVLEWLYTDACDRGETEDDSGKEYEDWKATRKIIAAAKGEQS